MTLQEYLAEYYEKGASIHSLTVCGFGEQGAVHFYIHPTHINGETPNYLVAGNELISVNGNGEAVGEDDSGYGDDETILLPVQPKPAEWIEDNPF